MGPFWGTMLTGHCLLLSTHISCKLHVHGTCQKQNNCLSCLSESPSPGVPCSPPWPCSCPQQLLRQSKQEPDFLVRCFALGKPRALVGSHVGNENQRGLYVHQRNAAFCSAKGVAFTASSSKGTHFPQTLSLEGRVSGPQA